MLKKFRDNQFHKALTRRKASLKRTVVNKSFEDSETFLLLFDCTTEEKYNEFTRVFSGLQLNNKKVYAVGFHGQPALPAYCTKVLHVIFLGKSDMNTTGIPSNELVEGVLSNPFDVLVDLTKCMHPVFHWIITLSAANLKIGTPARKNQHIFDISIEQESPVSQEEMMKMAQLYQNMFQKRMI